MKHQIDLAKYADFVKSVTSEESNNVDVFIERVKEMELQGINVPLLITGYTGLAAEGGEFAEIPKKMLFQGKPVTADNIFHMKRELGDVLWYWMNCCRALNLDPDDVIAENVKKLKDRYPGGDFDPYYSENRQDGDL